MSYVNEFIEEYFNTYYTEAGVEDKKDKTVKFKEAVVKANDKVNEKSYKIAKKVVRKPSPNAPAHVYDKYDRDIAKVRAAIKLVAIGVGNVILLPVPIPASNAIFNAVVIGAMAKSNDPADKMVMKPINAVANSKAGKAIAGGANRLKTMAQKLDAHVKDFFKKVQNKAFKTVEEVKKQFHAVDAEAAYVARQTDSASSGNNTATVTKEYVSNIYERVYDILSDMGGKITEESYEAVINHIGNSDMDDIKNNIMCESAIHILLKDNYLI